MSKHTPGPWLLVETPDDQMISSWHIQVGDDRISVFPYTRQYSECRKYSGLITDHKKMADARLMAAAPELLEACEEFRNVLRSKVRNAKYSEEYAETFYQAEKKMDRAIALAKGEPQ